MANPMQLFDITEDEITLVVTRFYEKVRSHPILGPIFSKHITAGEWPDHEAKIVRFWLNAILKEHVYDGNPMRTHVEARNVEPAHFANWLNVFDHTLAECLPPEKSEPFSALAHRIGKGLRFGLTQAQSKSDAPPSLF
jgi:hemoglobin